RTGCLALADRQNFGTIYFDDGQVAHAAIVNRRDRLGDILVRAKRITAEQLQIEEAVYYLFTWSQGTFNFEAGVRPEGEEFPVRINPEYLLLEGARRVDEWSLIQKKIPSFDLIFSADAGHVVPPDVTLSSAQQTILRLLDGSRDVQQLVEESGLVEFEVGQALYGLVQAGFAHRVGTSAAAPVPRVNEARVEEHRNLGIAFYKAGMHDEALREFRRVADLRPSEGSAPFYLGLIALRQGRWAEAVEALNSASEKSGPRPAAMHDLGLALEQLGRLDEAEKAFGDAATRARDDARVMLGWAVAAVKRGDHTVALGRLARAREILGEKPAPAAWYWAAALAHAGADDTETAVSVARAGVTAFPQQAVLRNNLAVLLEGAGDLAGAEVELRAALTEDPSLPQVFKNLADLCYRSGRYDEAYNAYERAAKLQPDLGDDLYFKLGNLAYKRRDAARARASWQRATELNPGHQLARANLDMLERAS